MIKYGNSNYDNNGHLSNNLNISNNSSNENVMNSSFHIRKKKTVKK